MKMKKYLSLFSVLALCVSVYPTSMTMTVSADSGGLTEFTEDFESYNIQSKVAPYQRANKTDFTGLDGTDNWQSAMAELMEMNGGYRYLQLYGDRLISAANPDDDLDAFKAENPELYSKIYGKGVYNGNAAGATITIFNYKGEPVSGNLGGVWYGISKNHDSGAMGRGGSIVNNKSWRDLMVENESNGNQYLQFSAYGSTGQTSSFGRYDLNIEDSVAVLSQRVFMDTVKAKQFDIRLTSGEPTRTDVNYKGNNIEIGGKTYSAGSWTFKNIVSDFESQKTIVTFDSSNKLLFLGSEAGTYSDETWYTVSLIINTKGGKSQVGLKVSDDLGNVICQRPFVDDEFISTASGVMYSHVESGTSVNANVYLDDISFVSRASGFELENTETVLAGKYAYGGMTQISFNANAQFDEATVGDKSVVLTDKHGNVVDGVSAYAIGNKITVELPELKPSSRYSLKFTQNSADSDGIFLSEKTFEFFTKDKLELVASVNARDGKTYVDVTSKTNGASSENYMICMMLYSENGGAVSKFYSQTVSGSQTVNFDVTDKPAEAKYCKIFAIDLNSGLKAISDCVKNNL